MPLDSNFLPEEQLPKDPQEEPVPPPSLDDLQAQAKQEMFPEKNEPLTAFKDSVLQSPLIMSAIFTGQILGKAYEKYEAARVRAVEAGPFAAAEGLIGRAPTQFPDAPLRHSQQKEFGDLLRTIGVPEGLAATGGVLLDLSDPLFVLGFKQLGQAAKVSLKGGSAVLKKLETTTTFKDFAKVIKESPIGKQATEFLNKSELWAKAKDKMLTWRANAFLQDSKDALMGKGLYDGVPVAERMIYREANGKIADDAFTITQDLNILNKISGNTDEMKNVYMKYLLGNKAPTNLISPEAKHFLDEIRQLQIGFSESYIERIKFIRGLNPAGIDDEVHKLGFDKLEDLENTIRNNLGKHVRQEYRIFQHGFDLKSIPPEQIEKAIQEQVDIAGKTRKDAERIINEFITKKEIHIKTPQFEHRVNKSSFLHGGAFADLPELKKLAQPVDDFFERTLQDVMWKAQAAHKLESFEQMYQLGFVNAVKTSKFSEQIVNMVDGLHWGAINNKWVTPETKKILELAVYREEDDMRVLFNILRSIKTAKIAGELPFALVRNPTGNIIFTMVHNPKILFDKDMHQKVFNALKSAVMVEKGQKFARANADFHHLIRNGVIGNELPLTEELQDFGKMIDWLSTNRNWKDLSWLTDFKKGEKFLKQLVSWGDQYFKGLIYFYAEKRLGLSPAQALEYVREALPFAAEPARLAVKARRSVTGLMLLNNYLSFGTESLHIMLGHLKHPDRAWRMALLFSSPALLNSVTMALQGRSMNDVKEIIHLNPDLLSDTILNPLSPDFDFNIKYLNPFNTKGVFSPFLWMAGVKGQNPWDLLLDLTQFSPEFGYQNLVLGPLNALLTGRDQYGNVRELPERVNEAIRLAGPGFITRQLPESLSEQHEPMENIRRAFKTIGIPFEERNAPYKKRNISKTVKARLKEGARPESLLNALNTLGYDGEKTIQRAADKVKEEHKKIAKQRKLFGII